MTRSSGDDAGRDQVTAQANAAVRAHHNAGRLSHALTRMASDLAEARRRVNVLERENAALRDRVKELEGARAPATPVPPPGAASPVTAGYGGVRG